MWTWMGGEKILAKILADNFGFIWIWLLQLPRNGKRFGAIVSCFDFI
jgi:hypothetical protein